MTKSTANIDAFLDGSQYAVAGASTDRSKFGNKVLRVYQQQNRQVYPINPRADEIEGLKAYPDLKSLPMKPHGVSVVTAPKVTEKIVDEAIELGITHIWMQPGAESDAAIQQAEDADINVIARGPCLLAHFGFSE